MVKLLQVDSDSRNLMTLEASPLLSCPLAVPQVFRHGQGPGRSRGAHGAWCALSLMGGNVSLQAWQKGALWRTPGDTCSPRSSAACCVPSLLSYQQLLYSSTPEGRDIFCSWLLLLETGAPACLRYSEILDKRELFFFQIPFFSLCFCHLTQWAVVLCLSSKLPVKPGNLEEKVDESGDLGSCDCPLSPLLFCR